MSTPAAIVAQELQDLAATVQQVAEAIKDQSVTVNVPEQAAPVIHVQVPDQQPPQVTVNVPEAAPPIVNVAPAAVDVRNVVNVPKSLPSGYEVVITERDASGYISRFTINPL